MQEESMDEQSMKKIDSVSCSEDGYNRDNGENPEVSEKDNFDELIEATHDATNCALLIDYEDSNTVDAGRVTQELIQTGNKGKFSSNRSSGSPHIAVRKTSHSTYSSIVTERTEEIVKSAVNTSDSTSPEDIGVSAADKMQRTNKRLSSISFDPSRLKRLSVVRKSHLEAGEHSRIKSWDMRPRSDFKKPIFPSAVDGENSRMTHADLSESLGLKLPNFKDPSDHQAVGTSTKGQQEKPIHQKGMPQEELEPNLRSLRKRIDKRSLRALMEASQKLSNTSSVIKLKGNQSSKIDGCLTRNHEHPKSDPSSSQPVRGQKVSYSYLEHLQLVSYSSQRTSSHSDPEDSQDLISQEPEEELSLNCLIQLGNLMEGRVVTTDSAASSLTCVEHNTTFHGICKFRKHIRKCITAFILLFVLSIASITSWHMLKTNTLQITVPVKTLPYQPFAHKFYKLLRHVNYTWFEFIRWEKENRQNPTKSDQHSLSRRFESKVSHFSTEVTVERNAQDAGVFHSTVHIDTMSRFLKVNIWNYLEALMGNEFSSVNVISASFSTNIFNHALHPSEKFVLQSPHSGPQFLRSTDWDESMQMFMTMTKSNFSHSFHIFPSLHGVVNNTQVPTQHKIVRGKANESKSQIVSEKETIIRQVVTNTSTALSIVDTTIKYNLLPSIQGTPINKQPQIVKSTANEGRIQSVPKSDAKSTQVITNTSTATQIAVMTMKCHLPGPSCKNQIIKKPQSVQSTAHGGTSKNDTMIPQAITSSSTASSIAIYTGEEFWPQLYFDLEQVEFELETLKPNKLFAQHAFLRHRQIADASNKRWHEALITDIMPCHSTRFANEKMCFVSIFECHDFSRTGLKFIMVEADFENENKPLMEIASDIWMSFLKRKLRRLRRLLGFGALVRRRRRFGIKSHVNM